MVLSEVTDPFSKIMLSTEKYIQFQSIHRPLETHPWNSYVRINNPKRKPLTICSQTLLLQANTNGNEIQCKTRTDWNMH